MQCADDADGIILALYSKDTTNYKELHNRMSGLGVHCRSVNYNTYMQLIIKTKQLKYNYINLTHTLVQIHATRTIPFTIICSVSVQHTNCLGSTAAHILSWILQQEYQGCRAQSVRGGMGRAEGGVKRGEEQEVSYIGIVLDLSE